MEIFCVLVCVRCKLITVFCNSLLVDSYLLNIVHWFIPHETDFVQGTCCVLYFVCETCCLFDFYFKNQCTSLMSRNSTCNKFNGQKSIHNKFHKYKQYAISSVNKISVKKRKTMISFTKRKTNMQYVSQTKIRTEQVLRTKISLLQFPLTKLVSQWEKFNKTQNATSSMKKNKQAKLPWTKSVSWE